LSLFTHLPMRWPPQTEYLLVLALAALPPAQEQVKHQEGLRRS
jgi:hypothetical protein